MPLPEEMVVSRIQTRLRVMDETKNPMTPENRQIFMLMVMPHIEAGTDNPVIRDFACEHLELAV